MGKAFYIDSLYQIKNSWKLIFHGIDISRVMATYEIKFIASGEKIGKKRNFIEQSFYTYDLSKLNFTSPNYILSTFGQQNRKDHKEVYDFVTSRLGEACAYNDLNQLKLTRKIRPLLIISVLLRSMWGLRNCAVLNFEQKLRLSCKACVYCNSIVDLEKFPLRGVKKYLSMYHVSQLENLITQYMKLQGIPTYSLCEGMYVVDKENLTLDSMQYANFETEHLLVWGQFVIDSFIKEGISKDKMEVGGYPHEVKLKEIQRSNKLKKCLVMLARRDFMEADMHLLNLLSQYTEEYDFYLKAHPNSDYDVLENFANIHNMKMVSKDVTINDCMLEYDFDWTIAVNTTAYYESLMRGIPSLRYDDGCYVLMPGGHDSFKDASQLEKCLEHIRKNLANGDYQKEVNNLLLYTVGVGIDNYKKILLG